MNTLPVPPTHSLGVRRASANPSVLGCAMAACVVALLTTMPAQAQVAADTASAVRVGDGGFAIRHVRTASAPPARVYEALTAEVARWWNGSHTWTADAGNLSIDARPGGCLCERLPDGGGVEHLRVVYAAPGTMLRFAGALGPLQGFGVTGHMTWQLAPQAEGTQLTLTYAVGGWIEGGFAGIAPAVSGVLREQLERLVAYVDTGRPDAPAIRDGDDADHAADTSGAGTTP